MANSFRRNKKITIQHNVKADPPVRDKYGDEAENWQTFTTAWAAKDPILGNEYFAAEQAQSEAEVKFRTDYISGVTDLMQIVHGDDIYKMLSVINVKSQNRELLMYCKEV